MKRFLLLALYLVVACGDVYAEPQPMPMTSMPPVVDASGKRANPPPVPPPSCPENRPRENAACVEQAGAICEYGNSADRQCNHVLSCAGNAWTRRPNETCFEHVCPANADVASLDGQPCALESDGGAVTDVDEAICNVYDGVCACTTGRDGASAHARRWVCVRPLAICPPNRPTVGTPCAGTLWCDYGSCAFKRGVVMECNGVWQTAGGRCD